MDDWELTYDEDATLRGADPEHLLGSVAASGVTDLFVLAHGWNTDRAGAQGLYDALVPLLRAAVAAAPAGTVGVPGFARVFWPSVRFPDTPAVVPDDGGALQAGEGAAVEPDAGTAALSGTAITDAVATGFTGPDRDLVRLAGRLIDEGLAAADAADAVRRQILARVHDAISAVALSVVGVAPEDAGELAPLLGDDPRGDYGELAEALGTVPPGASTQGLGDVIGAAFQGAKDAVRLLSYSTMKARAGRIGRDGLGPHLARLRELDTGVRVHLIGHSFGARLVAYALAGTGPAGGSPVGSLLLVQGAFSHYAFSGAGNPFGEPGGLHGVEDRVHGVLAATHSVHDRALGLWYPKMSALTRDGVSAAGEQRWGAVGADGFRAVEPLASRSLAPDGSFDGPVPAGGFLRIDAARVIADEEQSAFAGAHSDIRHAALARLAVGLARAGVGPPPSP